MDWQPEHDTVARLAEPVTVVPVEDEAVLHHAGQGSVHLLDPVATVVVQCLDGHASLAEIAADLAEVAGAPVAAVLDDVQRLVAGLGAKGLLDGVAGDPDQELQRVEEALVDGC